MTQALRRAESNAYQMFCFRFLKGVLSLACEGRNRNVC